MKDSNLKRLSISLTIESGSTLSISFMISISPADIWLKLFSFSFNWKRSRVISCLLGAEFICGDGCDWGLERVISKKSCFWSCESCLGGVVNPASSGPEGAVSFCSLSDFVSSDTGFSTIFSCLAGVSLTSASLTLAFRFSIEARVGPNFAGWESTLNQYELYHAIENLKRVILWI